HTRTHTHTPYHGQYIVQVHTHTHTHTHLTMVSELTTLTADLGTSRPDRLNPFLVPFLRCPLFVCAAAHISVSHTHTHTHSSHTYIHTHIHTLHILLFNLK